MVTMFSFVRRSHPIPPSSLHILTFLRHMGGGPRTFPGGLNKWQWKRLHEKQAKEKEKKLLDQEKQLYQARIRTQIRARVAGKSTGESQQHESGYGHMSPKDQVKALADRFMTEKAEDLWNEDDGPTKEEPLGEFGRRNQALSVRGNGGEGSRMIGNPHSNDGFKALPDPFKEVEEHWNGGDESLEAAPIRYFGRRNQACDMIGTGSGLMGNCQNLNLGGGVGRSRCYSVQAGGRGRGMGRGSAPLRFRFKKSKNSSSDDEDSDYSSEENDLRKDSKFPKAGGKSRYPKFMSSEEDSESELDTEGGRPTKKVMGRGVLESYDRKKARFVPKDVDDDEEECGLSEQVEKIREELMRRKLAQQGSEQHQGTKQCQGESLLSNKRFDECNISPLTVKALTSAGYVQMTKVQEATISVCLDGMDALVKAKTGNGKSAAFLF